MAAIGRGLLKTQSSAASPDMIQATFSFLIPWSERLSIGRRFMTDCVFIKKVKIIPRGKSFHFGDDNLAIPDSNLADMVIYLEEK